MSTKQESVSLTVSLVPDIPGWMETIAIVPTPETLLQLQEAKQQEKISHEDDEHKRKQAAERQKKSEGKKRDSGLTKDWVPKELVKLAKQIGWPEVIRLVQRPSRKWWKFWEASADCLREHHDMSS